MQLTVYACDSCGTHKNGANHWWRLMTGEAFPNTHPQLIIEPFDEARGISTLLACGEHCAVRMVAHYIQTGRLESLDKERQ